MHQSIFVPPGFPQQRLWEELLGQWLRLLKKFEEAESPQVDVAYWYGERPLTGLLSAAAWALEEGWSLEEFGAERGKNSDKQYGRCDLWVGCKHGKATIEAKYYWVERNSIAATDTDVRDQLSQASHQLRSLHEDYRVGELVSVCFLVPWFPSSQSGRQVGEKLLRDFEDVAVKNNWAYAKHLSGRAVSCGDNYDYPGVLLVAQRCPLEEGK